MSQHKFSVGERVMVHADKSASNIRPGIYTVTRAMPLINQGFQYRVKNALDSHERVLDEVQLHKA